ncbi:MAG: NAD(P)-dependent oxidoreductase [Planctomycetes bacterium GWF2_41_51]|nr:MAG: NAD(P)-dependent oxidoreductase [Planctomycetes bacterium GWF2_41_51]HBG27052.1 NAD(P)-dependent oxidoreductase [Phycisphaerales bacterium]
MGKGSKPPQKQEHQPGKESQMSPKPESKVRQYKAADKLKDKIAIITGGDSGIGKAAAIAFAKEGADCIIVYLNEHKDAEETKKLIEETGRKAITIAGDVGESSFCKKVVKQTVDQFGRIDILVNNAAEQHLREKLSDITDESLLRVFKTNIFAHFYMIREAIEYMHPGSVIINTTSITAYQGHPALIDYAATKGAIVSLTRSLAATLGPDIRVNAVAPGPIWTPLIPASFTEDKVESFGSNTIMGRPGEPDELAPCYVFLASEDSSYMTGQVLHPNGGRIINT